MSDLYNFHFTNNDEKEIDIPHQKTDNFGLHKIKHIVHKNNEARSKSAPLEEIENEDDSDFLSSYNYYIYYNSIEPRDPHLPKPTYVPKPDLGDIKETKAKDEEDQPDILNENHKQLETIQNMMNNLNLEGNSNMNDINKLINDIPTSNFEIQHPLGNVNNNSGAVHGDNLNNNTYNDFFNINNLSNSNENNNIQSKLDMIGNDNINLNNFINDNNDNMGMGMGMNINNNKFNINGYNNSINNKFSQKNPNNLLNNNNQIFNKNNDFDLLGNNSFNNKINNNMIMNMRPNNQFFNNDNFNNNFYNNNDQLLNMMLLQNIQNMNKNEGNLNQMNPNLNINYFNQQINNNNILLNNFNNNQGNLNNNNPNNFNKNFNFLNNNFNLNNKNMNMNNNINNNNNIFNQNLNYPNLFSNNFKNKNNNKNNFNMMNNPDVFGQYNQPEYGNMSNNFNNIQNNKSNNFKLKGNKGMSDFTNNQKRDITDIKHLEDLIQQAIQLKSSNNNIDNMNNYGLQNDTKDLIISKIKTEILTLAKDVTGNYAIQKILNNQKPYEVNFIIESVKNKIYELTLNLYGCRVVQELISILDNQNISIVTSELKPFYEKCIEDKNGNHVIQKLIEKLSLNDLNDIYLVSLNNIVKLSKHQYGCRVIQRLFKYCNEEQIKSMLTELFKDINNLIQDQYGNYVIQFILENQSINKDKLSPIYESLKGNVFKYSFHKFASNVIERCLTYGNEKQRKELIDEIIELEESNPDFIINMVKDRFANYVIQKMIEHSDNNNQQKLIKIIMSKQNKIKNDGFSKYVLSYIEKINGGNIKGNKFKSGNNNHFENKSAFNNDSK